MPLRAPMCSRHAQGLNGRQGLQYHEVHKLVHMGFDLDMPSSFMRILTPGCTYSWWVTLG